MKKNYKKGTQCLNCHHIIAKNHNFCSNCGQKNNLNRYTTYNLIHDFFYNFVSYDSKLRTSIRGLIKHPGNVPKEFVEGKRICYVNPFRLYFTFSVILILMVTYAIHYDEIKNPETTQEEPIIESIKLDFQGEENNKQDSYSFIQYFFITKTKISTYLKEHPKANFEEIKEKLQIEDHFLNRLIFNKAKKLLYKTIVDIALSVISQLPITLLITIPIISLIFSLIYFNHHFNYAEHLTFLLYNASFMFLAFIFFFFIVAIVEFLLNIESNLFGIILSSLFSILLLGYSYQSIKTFYQNSWGITIIKTTFLLMISFFIISLSITIVFLFNLLIL
ncbi:hypothetical protein UJ101_02259 [Flavobacteriaceae bacterium UJ101]|nr:hypothetical protein UJ101_02259 [Flavobacteriaceae bacterium UJ101]